jgi:hypothetical protein
MSWEAVTALGSVFTGLVILVTVIVAGHQLRAAREQLDELRRSTQLDGSMQIFALLRSPQFHDAYRFVIQDLADRLKDEHYRQATLTSGVDPAVHKERYILTVFEELGTYVKHDLLDAEIVLDLNSAFIKQSWRSLEEIVRLIRQEGEDNRFYENFEYLYKEAMRFRPD